MKLFPVHLLVVLLSLVSCAGGTGRSGDAPFPGSSYDLTEVGRGDLEKRVEAGDVDAAHRLADYYFLFEGDERSGIRWLERAGDMGDIEARKVVLGFLRKGGDEDKTHALELEKRWER